MIVWKLKKEELMRGIGIQQLLDLYNGARRLMARNGQQGVILNSFSAAAYKGRPRCRLREFRMMAPPDWQRITWPGEEEGQMPDFVVVITDARFIIDRFQAQAVGISAADRYSMVEAFVWWFAREGLTNEEEVMVWEGDQAIKVRVYRDAQKVTVLEMLLPNQ